MYFSFLYSTIIRREGRKKAHGGRHGNTYMCICMAYIITLAIMVAGNK